MAESSKFRGLLKVVICVPHCQIKYVCVCVCVCVYCLHLESAVVVFGNPLQYSCLENPMGGGAW